MGEKEEGWRPIETAPETELVCVGRAGFGEVSASRAHGVWWDGPRPLEWQPTQWRPLPAPPEVGA